jgi:hypothetical protein
MTECSTLLTTSSTITAVLRNTTIVMFRRYFGLSSKLQLSLKACFLRKFSSYDFFPVYLALCFVSSAMYLQFTTAVCLQLCVFLLHICTSIYVVLCPSICLLSIDIYIYIHAVVFYSFGSEF